MFLNYCLVPWTEVGRKMVYIWMLMFGAQPLTASAKQDVWVITNLEPPFIKQAEHGRITGYAAEVVRQILINAEVHQDILVTRWERLEKEANNKANVIVFALARTPERESSYHWITPLTANMYGIYAHQKPQSGLADLSELKQYSAVSVLRGDLRESILVDAGLSNIKRFDFWPDAVKSFTSHENEALFFSDPGMKIYCKALKVNCQNAVRIFDYDVRQSYLAVSKKGTSLVLVERLKQEAYNFKQSKEFRELAQHWLDEYKNTTDIPMYLEKGVVNLWSKH